MIRDLWEKVKESEAFNSGSLDGARRTMYVDTLGV